MRCSGTSARKSGTSCERSAAISGGVSAGRLSPMRVVQQEGKSCGPQPRSEREDEELSSQWVMVASGSGGDSNLPPEIEDRMIEELLSQIREWDVP